ncbi:uncharacterized protein SOCE26_051420 [Sorangium cellulosum]|uniref:DNA-directed DNA polymerase n=1 Tax=Sorangium cellulosum TaxID=56 RepID=A0A2L0EWL4_SORCE|nr:DNA polymerase [Sorangium cellulosum]AUX43690.1 uncharacterized protein SOCE26_051420 [Sorangium cellulosum]
MPPLPNVQRLAAHGPGSLADHVVVDVSAILRWIFETEADAMRTWMLLDEAVQRSGRHVLWIVAPCAPPCDGVDVADLDREEQRLLVRYGAAAVIRTHHPALASLREYIPGSISVITAGIDERLHQLLPLDHSVDQMLDIGTGRRWSRESALARGVEPFAQPELRAIVGAEPGDKGLTRDARKYESQLQHLVLGDKPLDELRLAPWLEEKLHANAQDVKRRVDELRGGILEDAPTISRLTEWVSSTRRTPSTTYLLPTFGRDGTLLVVHAITRRQSFFTFGDYIEGHLRDLHRDDPDRWFIPHGLDLCAWMAERALPLPRSVVDPAMAAFVLNPDDPPDLTGLSPAALGYPDDIKAWLMDLEREEPAPQRLHDAIDLLPGLDVELTEVLAREELLPVLEDDLAPTVPVLARIERRGAWVEVPRGYRSWRAVEQKLLQRLRFHEGLVRQYLPSVDPYSVQDDRLVNIILRDVAMLVPWHWPQERKRGELLERFACAGLPVAHAIQRLRSIALSGLPWCRNLAESGGRLRGQFVPQSTGRFGYRRYALQNIPKDSIEGLLIRSALRGPPGHVLFSVDYDSFEGRLLAAISHDPALLASAQHLDMHAENAKLLFGAATPLMRGRVKRALYAIGYGQQSVGFCRTQADMSIEEAAACFDAVVGGFPELMRYRDDVIANFRATRTTTSVGGWRRRPSKATQAINMGVQALAATIFRRVLRQLDVKLAPLGAAVLVQVHDEVIVATPPETAPAAMQVVTATMENAALEPPVLLPHPVPLFTKVHQGETWADL